MNAAKETIVTMHDVVDMTCEEIAADLGEDLLVIKSVLAAGSKKYRDKCALRAQMETAAEMGVAPVEAEPEKVLAVEVKKLGFTEEEAALIKEGLFELATGAEEVNQAVRLSALKYCWDDYHGRLDSKKDTERSVQNNILILQDKFLRAGKLLRNAKELGQMKSGEPIPA